MGISHTHTHTHTHDHIMKELKLPNIGNVSLPLG